MISMFIGAIDVTATMFGSPVPGALEATESTMVLIVFGGLAYAQIRKRHFRAELLYLRVGLKMRSIMDLIASSSAIIFFGLMAWQGWNEATYSLEISESSSGGVRFPLYPARFILVFGAALLCIQLILDLIVDVRDFGVDRISKI